MRLFTAIEIPPGVKQNLETLLHKLRPLAKLSWTRTDNLHVTTKFIGEWPEQRLEEMKRALESVGSPGPIDTEIREIGWFPNPRHPRVLWAGVHGGAPLQSLAHATEAAVHALGVAKEDREFAPHLTLARIKESVALGNLREEIEALPSTDFGSFRAASFYLYLSAGGRYTKLADFALT